MVTIKIILGSVRPTRFGVQPANWLMELSKQYADRATFELVDLAAVNLPLLDEPKPASSGEYTKEHTKTWAKIIAPADGFIFVTPEYNHGVAPSLKNAIDYLYAEWNNKPVSFVSYGADAGGSRSIEHLRHSAAWLQMHDLSQHLILPEYYLNLDEQGNFRFNDHHQKKAEGIFEQLLFWAEEMKASRAKLAAKQ